MCWYHPRMTFSRTVKKTLAAFVVVCSLRAGSGVSAEVSGNQGKTTEDIPVLRFPRRFPSGGLSWSRERYPEQYLPANMATNQFHGLNDRDKERFLDVANRAYSRELVTGFSYTNTAPAGPAVTLSYCRKAETFVGRLSARGLKPQFAYQIKLSGNIQADPDGFERIGRLGRWRQLGSSQTNFKDADYVNATDKKTFESYIFFDFFVTDHNGCAEKDFYLDSTLHVLFNQTHQSPPSASDSWPEIVTFTNTASWVYANPRPRVMPHRLYAETEAGNKGQIRPHIGEAFLPAGAYQGRVTLIEETFHGYGDEGFWPTVMACPVAFEVVDQPRPTVAWGALPQGKQIPFTDFATRNLKFVELSAENCSLVPSGPIAYPVLEMTNGVPVTPGGLAIVSFEVATRWAQEFSLYAGPGRGMKDAIRYRIPKRASTGWCRIEMEIRFGRDPKIGYLSFLFSIYDTEIKLRNLQIVPHPGHALGG